MKIIVQMEDIAVSMATPPTDKLAIISITDRNRNSVKFPSNPNMVGIYQMKFDDVYAKEEGAATPDDFVGFKEFVDSIKDKAAVLIVHCAAGLSRSPAVAEAIVKYMQGSAEYEKPDYPYKRNPVVYDLACKALEITRWIDNNYEIDFDIPAPIQELINEIEEHDRNGDLGYYVSAVDFLDVYAKRWIGDGLTQRQYDILRYKYR